jgi:hypothetical protein
MVKNFFARYDKSSLRHRMCCYCTTNREAAVSSAKLIVVFHTTCCHIAEDLNTGPFIMFSVITNVYNKKTKGPTVMEFFTATGKLKKFFWQLEMFDMCTTGDTAHIDTSISYRCVPCNPWCTYRISLVVKKIKNVFSFPVAVKNSITVGPLVFLL